MSQHSNYWKEGSAYHRTAQGARKRRDVFNETLIYNLLAMAIEKYFMAWFEANKTLPENHTFTDLINAAERIKPMPKGLADNLKALEIVQDICPAFDDYKRLNPDEEQIADMYEVTDRVMDYCSSGIG